MCMHSCLSDTGRSLKLGLRLGSVSAQGWGPVKGFRGLGVTDVHVVLHVSAAPPGLLLSDLGGGCWGLEIGSGLRVGLRAKG